MWGLPGRATRIARRASRRDEGVASALGAVLVLALLVTAYAYQARVALPQHGRDAEDAWSASLALAAQEIARRADAGEPGASLVPAAVSPQPVPLFPFGSASPARAGGVAAFDPGCASFNASHTLGSASIVDVANGSRGCLSLEIQPAYGDAVRYVVEWGGVLRVQGASAVVLAGPPLTLAPGPNATLVRLELPAFAGSATSVSFAQAGARVLLAPGGDAVDPVVAANAETLTWTLDTAHPAAWRAWLAQALARSGLDASAYSLRCDLPACALAPNGHGRVTLDLAGPLPSGPDLALAFGHHRAQLALG